MTPGTFVYPDLTTASAALARRIVASAREAVRARGRFRWVISGGRTPLPLFRLLAGPAGRRLPWGSTEVFFADERCVPPRHPDSNFGAAWSALLGRVPIPRANVHRMRGEVRPISAAAARYARHVGSLPARPDPSSARFDLVLLGLGPDGHTASLFPGEPALREERRAVVPVRRSPVPPRIPRLTLTVPALSSARQIRFLVDGADKADAVRDTLRAVPGGDGRFPASLLSPVVPTEWFLDRAAARLLGGPRGPPGG